MNTNNTQTASALTTGSVTLTIDQIKDLAEMAGLKVDSEITDDDRETEITVTLCPEKGVDDDGTIKHYKHVAYHTDYPEEGVCPLGSPNT